MSPVRRWAPWLAVVAVVVVAMAVGLSRDRAPATNAERVDAIAKQVRCLVCSGESVYESRSSFAENARADIARQIAAGRSDAQITAALVDAYGDQVLLVPPATGANVLLWVLPVAGLIIAIGGLAVAFGRWKRDLGARDAPDDEDRRRVEEALRGG